MSGEDAEMLCPWEATRKASADGRRHFDVPKPQVKQLICPQVGYSGLNLPPTIFSTHKQQPRNPSLAAQQDLGCESPMGDAYHGKLTAAVCGG